MSGIDIHAHLTPKCYLNAAEAVEGWHGIKPVEIRVRPTSRWTPRQRLDSMGSLGVHVQVVSTFATFYQYDKETATATAINEECNDEVHQTTRDYLERFAGFATIPMQDVKAAVAELERCVVKLGFKGAMIDDKVNGATFDNPEFLPFWMAAA